MGLSRLPHMLNMRDAQPGVPLPGGLLGVPLGAVDGHGAPLHGGHKLLAVAVGVNGQDGEVVVRKAGPELLGGDAQPVVVERKVGPRRRDLSPRSKGDRRQTYQTRQKSQHCGVWDTARDHNTVAYGIRQEITHGGVLGRGRPS
jgi:hypothetical protein